MKKGAKPELSAKWWSKNKAKTLKKTDLGKALGKWEKLRKELDDPVSRNTKLFAEAQKALLDVQKTAKLAQDRCHPKKHVETLACLKLFPKAVTDTALKLVKEEKEYNDMIAGKAGKAATFVWTPGKKTVDSDLWGANSSQFRMEVFLHPATPDAMLERLYFHLNDHVRQAWDPVKAWHEKEMKKYVKRLEQLVDDERTGKEIKEYKEEATKSQARELTDRIQQILEGMPAEVDRFLAKSAETKRLAKEFKTRIKTRLKRDLILGNISNAVAGVFGSATGGISGGASGASLGALGGPIAEFTIPIGAAVGAFFGALIGPLHAIFTGLKESIRTVLKYLRVESDYRKKLVKELADVNELLQVYSTIVDKGGAEWNVKDNYKKWSGAVSAKTQKLAKALEQHRGSVAVLQRETDKEGRKLVKWLDEIEAKEKDLAKLQIEIKDALKKAQKDPEYKKQAKEIKEKQKQVNQLEKELKKPRKPIRKLLATMVNANVVDKENNVEKMHKQLSDDVQEVLKNMDGKKAELLGAKTAKRIDEMTDLLHKIAPFSDAFLSAGKSVLDGFSDLSSAVKKLK